MKTAWKRTGAVLVSWLLLCLLALSASAMGPVEVGVAFWKDSKGEQTSLANDGIDTDRAATLTRQANGTYTLELPLKKLSRINITGRLSGLTIGDVTYDGTLSGSFDDDTALLTIKNLPASVLTGSDAGKALAVTCNLDMDVKLLGEITTPARLCIWAEKYNTVSYNKPPRRAGETSHRPAGRLRFYGFAEEAYSTMMLLPVISAGTGRPI